MSRFYVASKFENKQRVRDVINQLSDAGHINTFDWSYAVEQSEEAAKSDFYGVDDSEFLVGIFEEDYQYKGALVELGIALGTGKRIYILGNMIDGMIFMRLPEIIKVNSIDQIIELERAS